MKRLKKLHKYKNKVKPFGKTIVGTRKTFRFHPFVYNPNFIIDMEK